MPALLSGFSTTVWSVRTDRVGRWWRSWAPVLLGGTISHVGLPDRVHVTPSRIPSGVVLVLIQHLTRAGWRVRGSPVLTELMMFMLIP